MKLNAYAVVARETGQPLAKVVGRGAIQRFEVTAQRFDAQGADHHLDRPDTGRLG